MRTFVLLILFLMYIVIEAFIESAFMRRVNKDTKLNEKERDMAYIKFAVLSAIWPITILIALIIMELVRER